ncbi:MAG: helix-turn-helix domain-containing protein, partial [Candidatus Omnitrophota bacterium]
ELAKKLGLSRVAIFKRIKSGKIKAQKIGGIYIIKKKDLEEKDRRKIDKAVDRAFDQYGEVIAKLSNE